MSNILYGALALAFCGWAVSLGGLASLQEACDGNVVQTLGSVNCGKAYQFQWFVIGLEFVSILIGALFGSAGHLAQARSTVVGMFAVVTVLYIQLTDQTNTLRITSPFNDGTLNSRMLCLFSGALITSTFNFLVIIAAGMGHAEGKETVEIAVKETA